MAGKNDTSKTGSVGHSVKGDPTSQHIGNIKKSQGPAVNYDPKGHNNGFEQRNTMKPKRGMKHVQQKAIEMKLEEEGRDHDHNTVDLQMHGERDDEKEMPVPPAEKKAGMRT